MNTLNNVTFLDTSSTDFVSLAVDRPSDSPFSDELARVFQWITFSVLCQLVAVFGVVSNIINIICFVKQGFNDPVNVSFLGLAVADLGSLVTIMWTNLCLCPAFIVADLPFEPVEVQFLIGSMPHTMFTRISSWITALITLERCLCIIVPIKVRSIVTVKRATVVIAFVFIILMANTAPVYIANRLGVKFYPERNTTLIGLVFMPSKVTIDIASYIINNIIIPVGAFVMITVCTAILVVQLRNKTKWRQKSTVSAQADIVSKRNQKVAKMVVVISALFISCFTPVIVGFVAMSLEPEISVVGKHRNALFIFAGFGLLLESINSAANIFIYYTMSNKYKVALRQLFRLGSKM